MAHDNENLVSDRYNLSTDKYLSLIRSLRIMTLSNEYIIRNFKEIFDKMDEEEAEAKRIDRENKKEIQRLRRLGYLQ